jgi:hypothetical protein
LVQSGLSKGAKGAAKLGRRGVALTLPHQPIYKIPRNTFRFHITLSNLFFYSTSSITSQLFKMKPQLSIIYILTLTLTLASHSRARPLFSTFQLARLAPREGTQGSGSGAGIAGIAGIAGTSGSDADVIIVTAAPIVKGSAPTATLTPEEREEPTWGSTQI